MASRSTNRETYRNDIRLDLHVDLLVSKPSALGKDPHLESSCTHGACIYTCIMYMSNWRAISCELYSGRTE